MLLETLVMSICTLSLKLYASWWCFDHLYDVSHIKDLKLVVRSLLLTRCCVHNYIGSGYDWR